MNRFAPMAHATTMRTRLDVALEGAQIQGNLSEGTRDNAEDKTSCGAGLAQSGQKYNKFALQGHALQLAYILLDRVSLTPNAQTCKEMQYIWFPRAHATTMTGLDVALEGSKNQSNTLNLLSDGTRRKDAGLQQAGVGLTPNTPNCKEIQ
jgi:hypothetical protein